MKTFTPTLQASVSLRGLGSPGAFLLAILISHKMDWDDKFDCYKKQIAIENDKYIEELKQERFEAYCQYLKSHEWKEIRDKRKKLDGKKCSICGSKSKLHVHHKTYDNIGREDMDDLITVCYECHRKIHHYKEF